MPRNSVIRRGKIPASTQAETHHRKHHFDLYCKRLRQQ